MRWSSSIDCVAIIAHISVRIVQRLSSAGAIQAPSDDCTYEVTWYAPFYSGGGYSSEAMAFLESVDSVKDRTDVDISRHFSIHHHGDSLNAAHIDGLTLREKRLLMRYQRSYGNTSDCRLEISICHSEPGAWYAPQPFYYTSPCPPISINRWRAQHTYHIGRTMFETDRVPDGWLPRLDFMDEIWVPTAFSKAVFIKSGVNASKLFVVPEPVNTDFYRPSALSALSQEEIVSFRLGPLLSIPADYTVFLFVGKVEARKGISLLLHAYFDAFQSEETVMLLLLTSSYHSTGDFERAVAEAMASVRRSGSSAVDGSFSAAPLPSYRILTGIPQGGMPYLYSFVDALVRIILL